MKKAIIMDEDDNVATVLKNVKEGEVITIISTDNKNWGKVKTREEIVFGHKIAIETISEKDIIRKYGENMGTAVKKIIKGEHVHTHNVCSNLKTGSV